MTGVRLAGAEQVAIERLIDNAWTDFEMRLLSIGALYVVWGSFKNADELVSRYFELKGETHVLNRQAELNNEESERVASIRISAKDAARYRDWARQNEGQPILRDALISYCAAFENALKAFAIAFDFVRIYGNVAEQIIVSSGDRQDIIRGVEKHWSRIGRQGGSESTAKTFYKSHVLEKNPDRGRWWLADPESSHREEFGMAPKQNWNIASEAFILRNAIIHADGRLVQRVEIGREQFFEREEVQLTTETLRKFQLSFRSILYPMNTGPEAL